MTRRSLRGIVLTNLAKNLPRRPLAKAREARLVDAEPRRGNFLAKLVSTTPRNERLACPLICQVRASREISLPSESYPQEATDFKRQLQRTDIMATSLLFLFSLGARYVASC